MARFMKVRNKSELDALINTVTKNKNILKQEITEEALGKEMAAAEAKKQQAPITEELQNVVKKFDSLFSETAATQPHSFTKPQTRNILQDTLIAIQNNAPLFKEITKQIRKSNNDQIQQLAKNNTLIKELTKKMNLVQRNINQTTLKTIDVVTTIETLSNILETDNNEILRLLQENVNAGTEIVTELKASAGPHDLNRNDKRPPSSGSSPTYTSILEDLAPDTDEDDANYQDADDNLELNLDAFNALINSSSTASKKPPSSSLSNPTGISPTHTDGITQTPDKSSADDSQIKSEEEQRAENEKDALNVITDKIIVKPTDEEKEDTQELTPVYFFNNLSPQQKLPQNRISSLLYELKNPNVKNGHEIFNELHYLETQKKMPEVKTKTHWNETFNGTDQEKLKQWMKEVIPSIISFYINAGQIKNNADAKFPVIKSFLDVINMSPGDFIRNGDIPTKKNFLKYLGYGSKNISRLNKSTVETQVDNEISAYVIQINEQRSPRIFANTRGPTSKTPSSSSPTPDLSGNLSQNIPRKINTVDFHEDQKFIDKFPIIVNFMKQHKITPSKPTLKTISQEDRHNVAQQLAGKNTTYYKSGMTLQQANRIILNWIKEYGNYKADPAGWSRNPSKLSDSDDEEPKSSTSSTPYNNPPSIGHGIVQPNKVYDPYKMSGDGIFGAVKIDVPKLKRGVLHAYKKGKQIAYQDIPYDLHELLTKKYNPRKKYDPNAVQLFQKLFKHSEMPITSTNSAKFKHILSSIGSGMEGTGQIWDPLTNLVVRNAINSGNASRAQKGLSQVDTPEWAKGNFRPTGQGMNKTQCGNIKVFSDPEEVMTRLNILFGECHAGNTNKEVKNEIGELLDWLLKNGEIHEKGYKDLLEACEIND